mmetsp:Transcript_27085/g.58317  ORF Transcript_27085/g.58317 Transcript_27085/m.58317 type:complete len:972 (+) Transcript_27085:119-3034(+)|eukprot:CAMPEP_0173199702 /NCGR_PEP_ID=MMETSP1141-20130122/17382_1 /TAXON_ID=483371 /ORGANISM="non described non described, Strain CCMP2298" /LENGTH=971 /DNA_ID=CAMNT_0014124621 /DNA_START=77 /DNA_END=2992 /DNA_ORIENTATION=-
MRLLAFVVALCSVLSAFAHINKPNSISSRFYAGVQKRLLQNSFRTGALANSAQVEPVKINSAQPFAAPQSSELKLGRDAVYVFGEAQKVADYSRMKNLLGGKGANLAVMSSIGLTVPPGFTITTEVCDFFHKNDKKLPHMVWNDVLEGLKTVETQMGRTFGDEDKPLLVSVRSGSAISMPGMMDTVLNLGINDNTVKGLAASFGERFAMDSYRRFLNMFGTVVMDIPHHAFESELDKMKAAAGVDQDNDLTTEQLTQLVATYKEVYTKNGKQFLEDPMAQLYAAMYAVFDSWNSDRAIKYRAAEGITGLLGTAVNIQAMVYGNMGDTSGTGVCFTRDPNTGEHMLYGEYLINAQGEDVVAGIRTPQPISKMAETLPSAYKNLIKNVEILEGHYGDMQDIEFTIQEGQLFMLQTRGGKRTGAAAVKIAVDMVTEGLATTDQAITMVKPEHLNQLLHPQFVDTESASYTSKVVATGLPASPGAAVGRIVFTSEAAEAAAAEGHSCILVRDETSPEDVGGMWAAQGVLTARGGMTSHAAVVARGWGKPCICGCDVIFIDEETGILTIKTKSGERLKLNEGDMMSINGETGEVLVGTQELHPPNIGESQDATKLMGWVDAKRTMRVMANADNGKDAAEARRNGAQGIGLTRTEHMFFEPDRIRVVRRMILAQDVEQRKKALMELLPYQRSDFSTILEAMDGLPVTVRLLDPPLHEFLPAAADIDESFAADVGMTVEEVRQEISRMQEVNPMLGLRGCRLGVVMPELVEMQARALIEAALDNRHVKNLDPRPEIMVPLVGSTTEFTHQANLIKKSINAVFAERNQRVEYKLGTMIEVPRAALIAADLIKAGAEFFSYGTNDLTQMTFGFSRDDVGSYLPTYLKQNILEVDPFQTIDQAGVGQLIMTSVAAGRAVATKKKGFFKAGICGEHGGDPVSVKYFVRNGIDYVSCSPFRVPVARLAAAQAVVEMEEEKRAF